MQKTLPQRIEYEQFGRDPPTEGRLFQGSVQLRFECDNHWWISLNQAVLSKKTPNVAVDLLRSGYRD